jgi:hypothetical protein
VKRRAEASLVSPRRRNDLLPALKIESCPLHSLKLQERRLRKSDPAHMREVANSISAFGFNVPLLLGENNIVIDGHIRLQAARLLGLPAAPSIRVDHLDANEQKPLRLAQWSEIDLDQSLFIIPAPRMKMRREFRVPISNAARDVLIKARDMFVSDTYVFPGRSRVRR